MRPPCLRRSIGRATALQTLKTLFRLVLSTASHCSSFMDSSSVSRVVPALLTTMSMWPKASMAALISPSAAAVLLTSAATASARPPAAAMAATTSSAAAALDW